MKGYICYKEPLCFQKWRDVVQNVKIDKTYNFAERYGSLFQPLKKEPFVVHNNLTVLTYFFRSLS